MANRIQLIPCLTDSEDIGKNNVILGLHIILIRYGNDNSTVQNKKEFELLQRTTDQWKTRKFSLADTALTTMNNLISDEDEIVQQVYALLNERKVNMWKEGFKLGQALIQKLLQQQVTRWKQVVYSH